MRCFHVFPLPFLIAHRLRLGDTVNISPLPDVKFASSVTVVPFKDTIDGISGSIDDVFVQPYFKDRFRPLKRGDIFMVRGGMRTVEFKVTNVEFAGGNGGGDSNSKKKGDSDSDTDGSGGVAVLGDGEESEFCIVGPDTEIVCGEAKDALGREEDDRLDEIGYDDIGGCDKQLAQIRELVELPLRHPQIFRSVGE